MGTTCSRRRSQETRNVEEHDGPSEDEGLTSSSEDEARQRWQLLTHGARRLAFKRREWAYLGHQLADIKRRGRRGVCFADGERSENAWTGWSSDTWLRH